MYAEKSINQLVTLMFIFRNYTAVLCITVVINTVVIAMNFVYVDVLLHLPAQL